MKNKMKLEVLSKSENEAFARTVVAAFIAQLDPTVDELSDIKTAVSEAVTNSVIHAYENKGNEIIEVSCEIDGQNIKISVKDYGNGIKDINLAMQPLYTSLPELERSGMGFTVMQTFMDIVEVHSREGEGTEIIMSKKINSVRKDSEG